MVGHTNKQIEITTLNIYRQLVMAAKFTFYEKTNLKIDLTPIVRLHISQKPSLRTLLYEISLKVYLTHLEFPS